MNQDAVDPTQFAGEAPPGDANPEGFASNDQSADQTTEPVVPETPEPDGEPS